MTDGFSWRDLASIWGAGLSTLLAVGSIRLPVFHVEPGEEPASDLSIRVVNPMRKMIFIRDWKRLPIGRRSSPLGVFTDKSKLVEIGEPGNLWIAIKGGDEKVIKINWPHTRDYRTEAAWLLIFLWRGAWLLPIELPALVFISTKLAARINIAN